MKKFATILLRAVEILLAILIVSIAVNHFWTPKLAPGTGSKVLRAKVELGEIKRAIDDFHSACGYYPSDSTVKYFLERPGDCERWAGPYFKRFPIPDPWEHMYFYENRDGTVRIGSYGRDGKPGGSGYDADIVLQISP